MSNRRKDGDFNLDEELRSNIAANEEGQPIFDDHEDETIYDDETIISKMDLSKEEFLEKKNAFKEETLKKLTIDVENLTKKFANDCKDLSAKISNAEKEEQKTLKQELDNCKKQYKLDLKQLKDTAKYDIKAFGLTEEEKKYRINKRLKRRPDLIDSNILLSVRNLKQFFFFGSGPSRTKLKAVSNVSFDVYKGECLGIVGESGCGKTTTGRSIIKLYDITSGSVYYKGYRISAGDRWNRKEIKFTKIRYTQKLKQLAKDEKLELSSAENPSAVKEKYRKLREEAKAYVQDVCAKQQAKIKQIKFDNKHVPRKLVNEIQMIFQDPVDSLDPRMTVEDIIQEGLIIQGKRNRAENHKVVVEMLERVGLVADHASRYPHEFSGGQRQRIGIARALVMNPKLLICDEPISALDVSIRAQIINLLNELKEEFGLTIIFIAHDLSVVKYFCDRIAVMYFGKVVELASSDELFANPLHPYTKSLLSAIPKPNPITEKSRQRIVYKPNEVHDYSVHKPELKEIRPGHFIYCNDIEFENYKKELK